MHVYALMIFFIIIITDGNKIRQHLFYFFIRCFAIVVELSFFGRSFINNYGLFQT